MGNTARVVKYYPSFNDHLEKERKTILQKKVDNVLKVETARLKEIKS